MRTPIRAGDRHDRDLGSGAPRSGAAGSRGDARGFLYKPHAFPISGDGDFSVRRLPWRSWGAKTATAYGQAIEQQRPSHTNYVYRTRVTLSHRTYCGNIHRTVYNRITARILGPDVGVFGIRTLSRVYSCDGSWRT